MLTGSVEVKMRDWDKSEETKSKKDSITAILIISSVFALGFFVGVLWGLSWDSAMIDPESTPRVFAYAEVQLSSITHSISLHDGIGIRDEVQILS